MVVRPSIAVDLGTANTRVSVLGNGMVAEQPTSINLVNDDVNGVADDFFRYINNKLVTSPLRGGVIILLSADPSVISILLP